MMEAASCVGLRIRFESSVEDIHIAESALDEPSPEWSRTGQMLQSSPPTVLSEIRMCCEKEKKEEERWSPNLSHEELQLVIQHLFRIL
jgi:hypothetical protein